MKFTMRPMMPACGKLPFAPCIAIISATFWLLIAAKPSIHQSALSELERGADGVLLVTFKASQALALANDPKAMLARARKQGKESQYQHMSLEDFVRSPAGAQHYRKVRGEHVYESVMMQHELTKAQLQERIPNVQIISSIPISNSFLIKSARDVYEKLANEEQVVEINTNNKFVAKLPAPLPTTSISAGLLGLMMAGGSHIRDFSAVTSSSALDPQWNIKKINAIGAWENQHAPGHGENMIYAVADTGVEYTHPNIVENYLGRKKDSNSFDHNYAWWDGVRQHVGTPPYGSSCSVASKAPCDDSGHGTHVTSIAVGKDGYGVAPGAKWMACRNMDNGVGSPETYLSCLNFFLAPTDLDGQNPRPELRPHVIGNSYSCPATEGCSLEAMSAAVKALHAAGIFMSVSAGNEGPGCKTISTPPSIEPTVVSVGATDINNRLALFSSRGPAPEAISLGAIKPNVVAPGVDIRAAYTDKSYRSISGTSMASPHVSGAALIISSACPCLERDVDRISDVLERTTWKRVSVQREKGVPLVCGKDDVSNPDKVPIPNAFFGYGLIDVTLAVSLCLTICQQGRADPSVLLGLSE